MHAFNTKLVLALALSLTLLHCARTAPSSEVAGSRATKVSFSLPSDEGALVTVPLASARATVLDFFSPTCEPCKTKLPALMRSKAAIEAKGGRLVLVAVLSEDEPTQRARDALSAWGVTSSFLVDRGQVSQRELGVSGLPSTVILDGRGSVVMQPRDVPAADVVAALP